MKNLVQRIYLLCLFMAFCGLAIAADIPNNTIYYTSTDGKIVTPSRTDVFGANIVSNTYNNGQGIITFDGNVTSVANYAFSNCNSLNFIEISKSVKTIGNEAFYGCKSLISIEIPNSVTNIGKSAFANCSSLTSIVIPNSVTSIQTYTFGGCTSLTSITIPNSVTSIEYGAFDGCQSLTLLEIPSSVTSIGDYIFEYCSKLKHVICMATIPPSMGLFKFFKPTTLHVLPGCKNAYAKAENWKNFNIVENARTELNNKIYYTSQDGQIVKPHWDRDFGANIISNTYENGLGIITFDGDVKSVSSFEYERTLTSITIPNSVTSISGFTGCSSLEFIIIPNSVTWIGSETFSECTSLTSVEIPNSVNSIRPDVFNGCSSLTSITIPNSVTYIGTGAFKSCKSLVSIMIPNSVANIGLSAFEDCSSLSNIKVDAGNIYYDCRNNCNAIINSSTNELIVGCKNTIIPNSVTSIGNNAFYGCNSLTLIEIPKSVTKIGANAFYGCSSLTSIEIPKSVRDIGKETNVFDNCSNLANIKVDPSNTYYDSRNNCNAIIKSSTNELLTGCKNTIIPNSVTSIGYGAFYGCNSLTTIEIPRSVTIIKGNAFNGCSSLTSIEIPKSITNIYESTFYNCKSLTSVVIPNSVKYIWKEAFRGCSSLASIVFPRSLTTIGSEAFGGCFELTHVTCLATTSPGIGENAFSLHRTGILHVLPGCKSNYEEEGEWRNWFSIFEDAVDSYPIELADGKTFNEEATQENKEINYTRTFNNTSWQSLYIPFSMTYDDWKDDFEVAYINGIRQMDTDDDGAIDETIMDVVKIKSGSLIPNTPYLIKAKTTGNKTITVNDATLYKSEENSVDCSTTIAKYTFTGTYSTIPAATLLAYNYYAMGGGSLIMTDGTSDLKPFRWYLNVESRSPMYNVSSGAKAITINVVGEEEATGISQMTSNREPSSAIYDLNGRKITQKTLKSGLYIKNGKKVFIK